VTAGQVGSAVVASWTDACMPAVCGKGGISSESALLLVPGHDVQRIGAVGHLHMDGWRLNGGGEICLTMVFLADTKKERNFESVDIAANI